MIGLASLIASAILPIQSDSVFQLRAVKTESPPVVDGVVGSTEWGGAALAADFIQYEPRRGDPAETRTDALVLYDSTHFYVAFRVWDPEPPAAQLTRRDADLLNDDAVILVLDSHYDRRSAYYFITNVLGTQTDGRIANDGRTVDDTWDAAWRSAAQRTDFGWSVEMAIPFSSIKYAAGEDRTWGVNFGRSRRRTLEISFWAGPLENQFRVSQGGALAGLDVPPPVRRHQVITYGLLRMQSDAEDDIEAGGDLRYALTPGMALYATVNPDFATIEADQERINLTRFELSLPEKRPFFLEGAELFRQRIRTFYSRRIPEIWGGGQVLGKQGPWTLSFLGTRSKSDEDVPGATYTVARTQRDISGSSNVALMFANRTIDGLNEGSLGADATLFFTKTLGMTAQLAQSWGEYDTGTWAYFLRPSYDSPTGHFHVRYTHLGDRFADNANGVGFIRDDDRRELDAALERTFWIRGGGFERVRYDSNYNVYWSQAGELRQWDIVQSVAVELTNRVSVEARYNEELERFEEDFRNRSASLAVGYNTREFQHVRAGVQLGRNFGSDFHLVTVGAGYKVTPELSVEYDLQRAVFNPDPDNRTTWIHVMRLNQFFTPDLYLRVFYQTNSSIDRRNIQAVFVYRYMPPFGTVQLAFQRGTAEFGERSDQGNTLFLKGTVVF